MKCCNSLVGYRTLPRTKIAHLRYAAQSNRSLPLDSQGCVNWLVSGVAAGVGRACLLRLLLRTCLSNLVNFFLELQTFFGFVAHLILYNY